MRGSYQRDFVIANLADDLIEEMELLTGNREDRTPRFPRRTYNTIVPRLMNNALTIQENVILANNKPLWNAKRRELQDDAISRCEILEHLLRIVAKKGWISEKQRDRIISKTAKLAVKIRNWIASDETRSG